MSTAVRFVAATGVAIAATGPRLIATMLLGLAPAAAAAAIHPPGGPGGPAWCAGTAAVALLLGPLLALAVRRIVLGWSPFDLLGRPEP